MPTAKFLIEKTPTGYCAYSQELGVLATGSTIENLKSDAAEILDEQCEYLREDPHNWYVKFELAENAE